MNFKASYYLFQSIIIFLTLKRPKKQYFVDVVDLVIMEIFFMKFSDELL